MSGALAPRLAQLPLDALVVLRDVLQLVLTLLPLLFRELQLFLPVAELHIKGERDISALS